MREVTKNENCRRCTHFNEEKAKSGWYCDLNTISEVVEQGYLDNSSEVPNPELTICDEFEPP